MIERIFHCNINCTNLERSLEFYKMIGFKVILDFKNGMSSEAMAKAFNLPQAELRGVHLVLEDSANAPRIDLVEFQKPKTEGKPYSHLHNTGVARICLLAKDINRVYEDLKTKGVNFFSEPQRLPGTDVTIACFTDPDGTVLELLEGDF
ncbi:MAG: VOC family protein [Waterburya sp.]